MDSRTAAHTLTRIGDFLELSGVDRFRARAYRSAAEAVLALDQDDITPMYRDGRLAATPGIGPATLSVLGELIEHGESSYLERLRENVPEGLIEMARVPGLTPPKVRLLYDTLDVRTLDDLDAAAADGRLREVRGFGPKTVERVRTGIDMVRSTRGLALLPRAALEADRLARTMARHPDVVRAEVAGDVRRWMETVGPLAVAAECTNDAPRVLRELANLPATRDVVFPSATRANIHFVDGTQLHLSCATREQFTLALWHATGSVRHVDQVRTHAKAHGFHLDETTFQYANGIPIAITSEEKLYDILGLPWIPPELREGSGEVDIAAQHGSLPQLLTETAITGVLHCHSTYSDGSATIAEMAAAARNRGWQYIGITDHSMAASYAGGMSRDDVLRQHDEIDALNATTPGFRVLKGIECDILADGGLDYGDALLDRFDYVIGSIHSRFSMTEDAMTRRVLTAMDDPRLTILAHPTGRLLLHRAPYAIDLDAVLDRAAERGVALELNADPHRLDLDWRWCRRAKERGILIEIGPDAHSVRGLDHMRLGVQIARKGWLEAHDVLNSRSVEEILAFARRTRSRAA